MRLRGHESVMNIASRTSHGSTGSSAANSLPHSLINIARFKLAGRSRGTGKAKAAAKKSTKTSAKSKPKKKSTSSKKSKKSTNKKKKKKKTKAKKKKTTKKKKKAHSNLVISKGFVHYTPKRGKAKKVSLSVIVNRLSRKVLLRAAKRHHG